MIRTDAPRREPALYDLLCWEMFEAEGTLRHVDGALSAMLEYRGPDLASATAGELAALSRTLAQAVGLLGDGWLVHAEAQRLPAPDYPVVDHFPHPRLRELDEIRRRAYLAERARFRTRYFLTFTHRIERPVIDGRIIFTDWPGSPEALHDLETEQLGMFLDTVDDVARLLETRLDVRRLTSREMISMLYTALTCRHHPIQIPKYPISLESIFGAGELHGGTELRFSEHHIVPVSLTNYPEATTPALLAFLDELPFPLRAVHRYLPMDRYTARAAIESVRRQWSASGLSLKQFLAFAFSGGTDAKVDFADRQPRRMAEDADEAADELQREETSAGHLTSTFVTWDTDRRRAVDQAQQLVKHLRDAGFVALIEDYNAVEAYLGTLPGHGYFNVRRPIVTHRAFVDLAPTTAVWSGQLENPHPALEGQGPLVVAATEGSTPFFWSLASRDVQHTLVAGPVGAGKSTLVNLLMAQYLRYDGAQVFSFDKGESQKRLCLSVGGHHYAPTPDEPEGDRFAPLAHVDEPAERTRAADWIEDLLQLQGVEIGPPERAALQRALELLAGSSRRTLSVFAAKVQHAGLRAALAPYVADGPFAHLFGAQRSALREGYLHVVEMEALLPLRKKVLTPVVTHLFAEIERRLDGRPTLIVIEEAPNYLADSLFARRFRQWLLELRKKNAGVVFVTQLLSSVLDSELRDALLENCPNRVFLPNPAATDPHGVEGYRAFGLNERQIRLIAEATPKRDYYLDSPEGSRMVQLGLGEGELEILT